MMKIHHLCALLWLTWLAVGLFAAPAAKAPSTAVASSVAISTVPADLEIRHGLTVALPRSAEDQVQDESQLAEHGVSLVKRHEHFLKFLPARECWNCIVVFGAIAGVGRPMWGFNDNRANPQWQRGLVPTNLIPSLNTAVQRCRPVCSTLSTFENEIGFGTTLPDWGWLTYIAAPIVYQILPPGPPPPKE